MFCGFGTVGGGAGSFQLFKRFVFARNDDLRQGKVPVLEPRRLQFDAMVAESAIEAPSHEILLNFKAPKDGVTVEKPSFRAPPEIRR